MVLSELQTRPLFPKRIVIFLSFLFSFFLCFFLKSKLLKVVNTHLNQFTEAVQMSSHYVFYWKNKKNKCLP